MACRYCNYDDFVEYTGYNDYLENIKTSVCPGGIISININADGTVTKCPYEKKILGNLMNDSLFSIWINGYSKNIINAHKCSVVNFDIYEMFCEMEEVFSKDVKKCISAWTAQIQNKKKLCYRDLPCWYFVFK